MADKQNDPYFAPFPTSLRKLMEKSPATGEPVTPSQLAELLGTSAQTISYYINGKRNPSFDNIVSLCNFFDVSADYLLFGIESKHRDLYKQTGLSNDALDMLILAHKTTTKDNDLHAILSDLLSDRDFYEFLEDVDFHAANLKKIQEMDNIEREKKYPNVNMLGYSRWYLMEEIQFFILKQLKKRGYVDGLELD